MIYYDIMLYYRIMDLSQVRRGCRRHRAAGAGPGSGPAAAPPPGDPYYVASYYSIV